MAMIDPLMPHSVGFDAQEIDLRELIVDGSAAAAVGERADDVAIARDLPAAAERVGVESLVADRVVVPGFAVVAAHQTGDVAGLVFAHAVERSAWSAGEK